MSEAGCEISVVLPCFNERENLGPLFERLRAVLERVAGTSWEVLFVDDHSDDGSSGILDSLHDRDPRVRVLHLSRTFGHQAALAAGLHFASGRAVVLMDCDLQDPPEVVEGFVERWRDGVEVVFGVRRKRKEGLPKRVAYSLFYRSLRRLSGIDLPLDAGDFCLMDRAVVDVLLQMPESERFLRGLRAWVGFRQEGVPYERSPRHAGSSKYGLPALYRLAVSGYVGFSSAPLRLASWLGLASAFFGFALAVWAVTSRLLGVEAPRGWASTIAVIVFVGGMQLLVLGVIGEYLGRILDEVRRRPRYVIRSRVGFEEPAGGRPPTGSGR